VGYYMALLILSIRHHISTRGSFRLLSKLLSYFFTAITADTSLYNLCVKLVTSNFFIYLWGH